MDFVNEIDFDSVLISLSFSKKLFDVRAIRSNPEIQLNMHSSQTTMPRLQIKSRPRRRLQGEKLGKTIL